MIKWRDTQFFGMMETLTEEQKLYLDAIENPKNKLIIVDAKAGTGKTTLAVGMAKLSRKNLLYLFSPCEEKTMGYRPGGQEEKELEYLGPLKDALEQIGDNPSKAIKSESVTTPSKEAWVIAKSHIFLRGTNKKNLFVIIDEAQNWLKKDLKKTLTRFHDDCKVVLMGNMGQCDLPEPSLSGFPRVIEYFSNKEYCQLVTLTKNFRGVLAQDAEEL
jgi:phosphate starvation-inducible protein PhoH and related proteins